MRYVLFFNLFCLFEINRMSFVAAGAYIVLFENNFTAKMVRHQDSIHYTT